MRNEHLNLPDVIKFTKSFSFLAIGLGHVEVVFVPFWNLHDGNLADDSLDDG